MDPNDVPSPCINICKIDEPTQRCTGCDRSIDEITRWSRMDNASKQAVIDGILVRHGKAPTVKDQATQTAASNLCASDINNLDVMGNRSN